MKMPVLIIASALVLTACGGGKAATATAPATTASPKATFDTTASRDQKFIAALQASPNMSKYASQTSDDLIAMAKQDCTDIETGHSVQVVVKAMNITSDQAAVSFLVRTAITTYCPNYVDQLPDLIGN